MRRASIVILMMYLTLFTLSAHPPRAEGAEIDWWTSFGHDASNNRSSTSGGPRSNILLWSHQVANAVRPSIAVADGVAYTGTFGGYFYALNANTGAEIWSKKYDSDIWASPAIAGGRVYVGVMDGTLHALRTSDGEEVWKYATGGSLFNGPTVVGGTVYQASTDGAVYALDAATGAKKWSFQTAGQLRSTPAVVNGILYIGSLGGGRVYALDAAKGTEIWSFATAPGDTYQDSSPAVVGGVVYIGSIDFNVYALNAATGAKIWSYKTGSKVSSSPAVVDGVVYVGSEDRNLYALDAAMGTMKWNYAASGVIYCSPSVANGVVYIGDWAGDFHAVNASKGTLLWKHSGGAFGAVFTSPAIANGVVYIGSYDKKVYAFGTLGDVPKPKPAQYTLTATIVGGGVVSKNPDKPYYLSNETVQLTAIPNTDYKFTGWSGDLSGTTETATVLMTSNKNITVTFIKKPDKPAQYALTISIIGGGVVSQSPNKPYYQSGETVQLSATPNTDHDFTRWSGDLTGTANTVTIMMTANKSITATFTKKPEKPTSTSTIITSGIINGTVVASSRATLSYENPNPRTASYEVKVDDGQWVNVGTSTSFTASGLTLGDHEIEVRALDVNGAVLDSTKVSLVVSVWVPPVTNAVVSSVATVGVFSLVSMVAATISSPAGFAGSWLGEKLSSLLPEGIKGWLESFIASKRSAVIEAKKGSIFTLTRLEAVAYAVVLVVLTFAFSYASAGSLEDFLLLIPTVLVTSVVVGLVKNLVTVVIARSLGVWAEHRVWGFGLATFLFSTLAFRTPFSSPSRIVNHAPKITLRALGLVASSSVLIALGFAGVFYVLLVNGFAYIGSIGLAMCLLMALFDVIPVAPMNGRDIFDWSKPIWAFLFLVAAVLYTLWLLYM